MKFDYGPRNLSSVNNKLLSSVAAHNDYVVKKSPVLKVKRVGVKAYRSF